MGYAGTCHPFTRKRSARSYNVNPDLLLSNRPGAARNSATPVIYQFERPFFLSGRRPHPTSAHPRVISQSRPAPDESVVILRSNLPSGREKLSANVGMLPPSISREKLNLPADLPLLATLPNRTPAAQVQTCARSVDRLHSRQTKIHTTAG